MHFRTVSTALACLISSALSAQVPQGMDLQALKQALQAAQATQGVGVADTTPASVTQMPQPDKPDAEKLMEESEALRLDREIRQMKRREKGPRRFCADLFQVRQHGSAAATEGGIAEDYVLGTGDGLNLNVFGSATFDLPVQVDGRGEIVIPKVGTAKVGGLTLGKAKQAVQSLVGRSFSRSWVDLQVIKLREVRVFIMGEVYMPGSYLVSSLSSLVNVLSLAGGPTAVGSYRDIRVMRGGKKVNGLDLYLLRAEGLGNPNVALQNGDTVFVPLVGTTVLLEGGFVRVTSQNGDSSEDPKQEVKTEKKLETAVGTAKLATDTAASVEKQEKAGLAATTSEAAKNLLPLMQFELKPEESAQDAVRFAGGLLPDSFPDSLSLRRQDREGLTTVQDLFTAGLDRMKLMKGDVLSAYPRRDRTTRMVSVVGWVRVAGSFGRPDGLTVGALLKRDHQVLPDTYLVRGEIQRTLEDGTVRYLAFHVGKALAGDLQNDVVLEDRDLIELFPMKAMRLPRMVSISGPLTHPGIFELGQGMRVADLVFKGGIPEKRANLYYAELARRKNGKVSQVIRLDLAKLISTETGSPVNMSDDAINPSLEEDDQVSVYEKPDFKIHRIIKIMGQVARPGSYVVDVDHFTLSLLVERAGGLTPEAMPRAGILMRRMGSEGMDVTQVVASPSTGLSDVLARLSETKMYVQSDMSTTGQMGVPRLFTPPVMHGLDLSRDNRLVVNFELALKKQPDYDPELQDGDTVIIPRISDTAMVLGEAATPFALFRVNPGMTVSDLLKLAGGTTRNADVHNIRLMRANGMIVDSWVSHAKVEPGDALLIPQRFRRDTTWQENLQALTPLALMLNVVKWHP